MKTSAKGVPRVAKKRPSRSAAKTTDPDLAQLALALESAKAMNLSPPEPPKPQHNPAMWSSLFGMWS